MENRLFKNLDYGKRALLIPILVIIAVVLGESLFDFISFETRQQYRAWFYLILFGPAFLISLISIIVGVYSLLAKQSSVLGIIGIVLNLPVLVYSGFILAIMLFSLWFSYSNGAITPPRLH